MSNLTLDTAVGNYGYTDTLKDNTITSEHFSFNHIEVSPVPMIFRRMVRSLEFDVAEMPYRPIYVPGIMRNNSLPYLFFSLEVFITMQ